MGVISHRQTKRHRTRKVATNVNNYKTVETRILEVQWIIENKSFNLQEICVVTLEMKFSYLPLLQLFRIVRMMERKVSLWSFQGYIILLPFMELKSHTQLTWLQPEESLWTHSLQCTMCAQHDKQTNKQTSLKKNLDLFFHEAFWDIIKHKHMFPTVELNCQK